MSKGIVVQNKESGIRYAVYEDAHDKSSEDFVRDLKPGESVLSYIPKVAPAKGDENDAGDDSAPGEETLVGEPTSTPPSQPTTNTKK